MGDACFILVNTSEAWSHPLLTCVHSGADLRMAGAAGFHPSWLQAWRISARHVTSSATCRAACHLMAGLLSHGLLQYPQVKDLAEGMLSSVDLDGPADAVDSTVHFWAAVAALRATDNLGSAHETVERVLRWLFMRWSPSKPFYPFIV